MHRRVATPQSLCLGEIGPAGQGIPCCGTQIHPRSWVPQHGIPLAQIIAASLAMKNTKLSEIYN